jgi:hypothetical protein
MNNSRVCACFLAATTCFVAAQGVEAHGSQVGEIVIDHPYALPSPAGSTTGAMYFRGLKNSGTQPDRLLGAHTLLAASVEIRRATMDGDALSSRTVDALPLPPKATVKVMHGGEWQLMLRNLKSPLEDGDRFAVTLRFERAGEKDVIVWVQQPR